MILFNSIYFGTVKQAASAPFIDGASVHINAVSRSGKTLDLNWSGVAVALPWNWMIVKNSWPMIRTRKACKCLVVCLKWGKPRIKPRWIPPWLRQKGGASRTISPVEDGESTT